MTSTWPQSTRRPCGREEWSSIGLIRSRTTRLLPRSVRYAVALLALRRTLRSVKPDLVHAHYARGYGLFAAAVTTGVPPVVSAWGTDVLVQARRSRLHAAAMWRALGRSSVVCATSQHLAEETAGYTRKTVSVTPFGVDGEQFRPRGGPLTDVVTIGMVKRLDENSGVDMLLEAYAVVCDAARYRPDWSSPGRRSTTDGCAEPCSWARRVRRRSWGMCPIRSCLRPRTGWTCSRNPACGPRDSGWPSSKPKPAAHPSSAADLGGLPEVVDEGVTGLLTPPGDVAALQGALLALVNDPDRRERMGGAARAFVLDRHSQEAAGRVMERVYRDALDAADSARAPR